VQTVIVRDITRDSFVGDKIEVADTSFRRVVGLLGRSKLMIGGGLWIRPSSGIHTFGMLFPIDVIGLNAQFRVVKLWNVLRPQRLTAISLFVKSMLELPAGTIAKSQVEVGDFIQIMDSCVESS
jgi:uncharacterized membrane protein (UPF0127 family)